MLHGPRLLVLDEPFEAVDPVSAAVVRAILDGFTAAGGTVLMSSHVMALVEQLCDHVAVLDHGQVRRAGTLAQVRAGHSLEEAFAAIIGRPAAGQGAVMVRVLIGLRRAVARHQLAGTSTAALAVTAALVLVAAVATLLTGWMSYAREATATDVLALVSLLWIGGRIAQSALSGEPFLRPEMFSLLPLPRRRLGWSLLLVGLLDPANVLAAVALSAVLVHGIRLGPAAAVTAVFAVAFTVTAGSVLSTVAAGILGPGRTGAATPAP